MIYTRKFFIEENGKRKLKDKYSLGYSFSPGFYDKLSHVYLYIDKKYNYELILYFSEYNEEAYKEMGKPERIIFKQNSKLPFVLKKEMKDIFEHNLLLQKNYYNDNNVFGIMDRNEKYYEVNHNSGYFSIDLTLDTLNRDLFQTECETKFLKLTQNIELWITKLRDDLMDNYDGHKKNGT